MYATFLSRTDAKARVCLQYIQNKHHIAHRREEGKEGRLRLQFGSPFMYTVQNIVLCRMGTML